MPRCQELQFPDRDEAMAACQQRADAQSGIVQEFKTWARVVVPDVVTGGYILFIARWDRGVRRNAKSKP